MQIFFFRCYSVMDFWQFVTGKNLANTIPYGTSVHHTISQVLMYNLQFLTNPCRLCFLANFCQNSGSLVLMSYLFVDNEKLAWNSDKKNPFSKNFRKMSTANVEELPTLQAACQADFKNCSGRFQMSHEDT